MAGDWIKMTVALSTSPKVVRISSAINADVCPQRVRVVGGLHALWCLFDQHSTDGKLAGYTLEMVDEILGWPGFAKAVADAGWLVLTPQGIEMPEFETHNGAPAKRRAQEADRKRGVRNLSAERPHPKRTKSGPEKNREESKPPVSPPATSTPDAFSRFWSAWPASTRKGGKGQCVERWRKEGFDSVAEQIVAHVEAMKLSIDWRKEGGAYIPAPLVYLNGKRWEGAEAPPPQAQRLAI